MVGSELSKKGGREGIVSLSCKGYYSVLDGLLVKGKNLTVSRVLQEYIYIFKRIRKTHVMVKKHPRRRAKIFYNNLK